jgi:hypothetical protein
MVPKRKRTGGAGVTCATSLSRSEPLMPSFMNPLAHLCCLARLRVRHFLITDRLSNCKDKEDLRNGNSHLEVSKLSCNVSDKKSHVA